MKITPLNWNSIWRFDWWKNETNFHFNPILVPSREPTQPTNWIGDETETKPPTLAYVTN